MSELTEQDWLDWRREGATATGIADAANGTYGGEYSVVAEKLGLLTVEVTEAMERGHRWEERVADLFHLSTGMLVVGEQSWCEWADNPRIRSTVDGFASDKEDPTLEEVLGVVEIKTYGLRVSPPWERWDDQVQIQMLTSGTPRGWIVAAQIDDDTDTLVRFSITPVERDETRISWLVMVAERLLELIDSKTLPTPDQFTSLDDVKQVNASCDPELPTVELDDDTVSRFMEVKEAIKLLEAEKDELEAKLRHEIGEAPRGASPNFVVTCSKPRAVLTSEAEAKLVAEYPEYASLRLDKTAFKKDHKTLYAEAVEHTGGRTLTPKRLETK